MQNIAEKIAKLSREFRLSPRYINEDIFEKTFLRDISFVG